ncbi:reverse transcriptase domain-containing protein [Aeromonas caviae]
MSVIAPAEEWSLEDIGLAYRKAKVDLFYSSHASLSDILNYEEDLQSNLASLLQRIEGKDESWVTKPDFIGSWTLAAKSVDMSGWEQFKEEHGNGLWYSSPEDEWQHACNLLAKEEEDAQPKAEFRVMARCSMDFHVLSTLWILKVGHLFDAKLSTSAYGNRLRRTQDGKQINPLSLGSFQPYLKPFRDWRDHGIQAMRSALNDKKKIVALTADVSSFYHELNPCFMLDDDFISGVLGLTLSEEQARLNRLFVNALSAWSATTPLQRGLPVGLPASAVVANMALVELDRIIAEQVAPIHYGRYVDDIILVMENGARFNSSAEFWEWLFARADKKLGWKAEEKKGEKYKQIIFQPSYLSKKECKSEIVFANAKNKLFLLAGETGINLVDAIGHHIRERASEWRSMPRLPQSAEYVGTDLLSATQSDGEAADNLRKADALTMRRAGFAIKLRDFEAYERDLIPAAWQDHRHAFFRAFIQHVLVLPRFFDLEVYLPRVIRLATACEDFAALRDILSALKALCAQVEKHCRVGIKACSDDLCPSKVEILSKWRQQLYSSVRESITAAFPPKLSKAGKRSWEDHMANWPELLPPDLSLSLDWPLLVDDFQSYQAKLFAADLAHQPFRFIGLPKEMVTKRGIPAKKTIQASSKDAFLLPESIVKGNQQLAQWIKLHKLGGIPRGLLFATRPFNLPELFLLHKAAYQKSGLAQMQAVVLAVRGFTLSEQSPCFDKHGVLQVSEQRITHQFGVAVSSWKTQIESWVASVTRLPDPDASRYGRLCRLLDGVIAQPQQSRYLILPELALPAHWFIRIARKLQGRGISLIAGVEYLHARKSRLHNQVWAAMSHDGLGFPALMIYRQDKQRPALHEEQELHRLAGKKLRPNNEWRKPPIIQHGKFRFALLICSELTNISYRAALRGKVDALFVPEWNQDTDTFHALVESAALDMHAYVIQCNDRQYGDSRIRAPFKERHERDVLRVKGGVTDYCVIGEINIHALREFQSSYRSSAKGFKPVPDGFATDMAFDRKVLPKGE